MLDYRSVFLYCFYFLGDDPQEMVESLTYFALVAVHIATARWLTSCKGRVCYQILDFF